MPDELIAWLTQILDEDQTLAALVAKERSPARAMMALFATLLVVAGFVFG